MGVLAAILAGVGLVGGIAWAAQRAQQGRIAALQAAAERMGWGFRDAVPFETIPDLERFELFREGRSKKLTNLMTSPAGDPRGVVFEYTYTTGGGKSQQTHRQTVLYVTSDALRLPVFSLRPQHFLHSIGKMFGYQDIDIERHPTFSEMFVLRGENEFAVRAAFTERPIEFFEQRRGVCAAGTGRELLLWRAGRRVAPDEIEPFVNEAFDLARRFSQPTSG
jgi:hypothetical protein